MDEMTKVPYIDSLRSRGEKERADKEAQEIAKKRMLAARKVLESRSVKMAGLLGPTDKGREAAALAYLDIAGLNKSSSEAQIVWDAYNYVTKNSSVVQGPMFVPFSASPHGSATPVLGWDEIMPEAANEYRRVAHTFYSRAKSHNAQDAAKAEAEKKPVGTDTPDPTDSPDQYIPPAEPASVSIEGLSGIASKLDMAQGAYEKIVGQLIDWNPDDISDTSLDQMSEFFDQMVEDKARLYRQSRLQSIISNQPIDPNAAQSYAAALSFRNRIPMLRKRLRYGLPAEQKAAARNLGMMMMEENYPEFRNVLYNVMAALSGADAQARGQIIGSGLMAQANVAGANIHAGASYAQIRSNEGLQKRREYGEREAGIKERLARIEEMMGDKKTKNIDALMNTYQALQQELLNLQIEFGRISPRGAANEGAAKSYDELMRSKGGG